MYIILEDVIPVRGGVKFSGNVASSAYLLLSQWSRNGYAMA